MSIDGAVNVAIEKFEATLGDERTRLLAALEAYTVALQALGVIPPQAPRLPFEDAEGAARWLAETAGHPRYSGDLWETLLDPGHDLTLVQAVIRTRGAQAAPGSAEIAREAVRLVTAQQAAHGASQGGGQ